MGGIGQEFIDKQRFFKISIPLRIKFKDKLTNFVCATGSRQDDSMCTKLLHARRSRELHARPCSMTSGGKMNEELMTEMRETLAEHARMPFGVQSCQRLFADNPEESAELLHQLFDKYDEGAAVEPDIRALIRLQRGARKYVSAKRTAALKQMAALRDAYMYPPTCQQLMHHGLLSVVRGRLPSGLCEALVQGYPEVGKSLLAQMLHEQRHDKFYEVTPGGWLDSDADIAALRSMIARTTARRLLDDMDGAA